jgi:peptide/nickel transport system permease protein
MAEATLKDATKLAAEEGETPFRRFVSEFAESKVAVAAAIVVAVIVVLAVFAPWIAPQNPYDPKQLDLMDNLLRPGAKASTGFRMWLGSDEMSRDLWSAILYGLRISLTVGIVSGAVALCFGTAIGLVAAYAGGRVDSFIMRWVDVQLSFPAILVALILIAIVGKGTTQIIVALVLVQWAYYARTARAAALVEREKDYVAAAHCLALSRRRILFRHMLPNCLPPLIVIGTIQTAHAIALEATLSFLGIGLPQTEPSLGRLIALGGEHIMSGRYWISVYPGVALLCVIGSINLVGDRMRDVLNPRLRK